MTGHLQTICLSEPLRIPGLASVVPVAVFGFSAHVHDQLDKLLTHASSAERCFVRHETDAQAPGTGSPGLAPGLAIVNGKSKEAVRSWREASEYLASPAWPTIFLEGAEVPPAATRVLRQPVNATRLIAALKEAVPIAARPGSDSPATPCYLVIDRSLPTRVQLEQLLANETCEVVFVDESPAALRELIRSNGLARFAVVLIAATVPASAAETLIERLRQESNASIHLLLGGCSDPSPPPAHARSVDSVVGKPLNHDKMRPLLSLEGGQRAHG